MDTAANAKQINAMMNRTIAAIAIASTPSSDQRSIGYSVIRYRPIVLPPARTMQAVVVPRAERAEVVRVIGTTLFARDPMVYLLSLYDPSGSLYGPFGINGKA